MKQRLTLILVVVLVLSAFPMASAAKQDTAELLIWADEARAGVIEELGGAFEEEYSVTLTVQQLGFGDIRDQLSIAGPAGEGPDIIIGAHDWLGELVTNGLLAPVDLGEKAEDFSPVALQAFNWDGDLYGVPYAIENIGLFYNTDLVDTPPATWAELRAMSEEIQASGAADYGYITQYGDPYHFYPIMSAFGGYIFGLDELGNYTPDDIGVNNEGSVEALAFIQSMVADGLIPEVDGNAAQTLFQDGNAAMYITGPWNIANFEEAGLPFAIAPIPAAEEGGDQGAPFLGVQAFMVSAFSENPLLAQLFLTEFVATTDVQLALYEAGDRSPAMFSAQEMVDDPYQASLAEAGANGQPMPNIPAMSAVWSPVGDAITLAIQDPEEDAASLLDLAAEAIVEAVSGE